jgi:DNA-binding NarL/FixJ family response regulator
VSTHTEVLIVEDSWLLGHAMVRALGASRCELAGTAARARTLLEARSFRATIVDIGLPDDSGLDLVRDTEPNRRGRTLIITGLEPTRSLVNDVQAVGAELACKPFSIDALQAFIARMTVHERITSTARRVAEADDLSPRQRDVVVALARGIPPAALHLELGIERTSLRTHIRRLIQKGGHAGLDEVLRAVLREHDDARSDDVTRSSPVVHGAGNARQSYTRATAPHAVPSGEGARRDLRKHGIR